MTVDLALPERTTANTSQATAIEQSRAIAEVKAAVFVAQQCPRDMGRAEGEMKDACGRLTLANRAFYRVPNRGNGPSVHLARELARIWGNIDYGVRELRRDEREGVSEIQAFAWDQQTNTRSSRSFIVPHQRMKAGKRQDLTDLGDVYLNNQNVGARAVRECIFTVLPTWFTEDAQTLCHKTIENGEGVPLPKRIEQMVTGFHAQFGVKVDQIEARLGRKRGQWDAGDVAQMQITYGSIQRGEMAADEEFPNARATAADLLGPSQTVDTATGEVIEADAPQTGGGAPRGQAEAAPSSPPRPRPGTEPTKAKRAKMFASFRDAGFTSDPKSESGRRNRLGYIAHAIGREVETSNELSSNEVGVVIAMLEADADNAGIPPEEAS